MLTRRPLVSISRCAELVQLGDQQARMHGDARPDDAQRARIEDASRDEMHREAALLD